MATLCLFKFSLYAFVHVVVLAPCACSFSHLCDSHTHTSAALRQHHDGTLRQHHDVSVGIGYAVTHRQPCASIMTAVLASINIGSIAPVSLHSCFHHTSAALRQALLPHRLPRQRCAKPFAPPRAAMPTSTPPAAGNWTGGGKGGPWAAMNSRGSVVPLAENMLYI